MVDLNGFDADNVEVIDFSAAPAGDYLMVAETSEWANTRNGGQMLKIGFKIVKGEHEGKKVWTNLNLKHSKPDVVKFAQSELASLCKAVGVVRPKDSAQLHDKVFVGHLTVRKYETYAGEERTQNVLKRYSAVSQQVEKANTNTTEEASVAPWKR